MPERMKGVKTGEIRNALLILPYAGYTLIPMNTKTAIAVVIAVVVVFGAFALFGGQQVPLVGNQLPAGQEGKASMVAYANEAYDLAFEYPSNLFLYEREDAGTPERPQLALFLVEDTQENRDVLEGRTTEPREGPTGITVDAYQNPDQLSARAWAETDTNWTVVTAEASDITVAGREGISFTWSGLYEGKTVVVTEGDKAYVFSVTWMTPEDQILRDFDMVLNSLQLGA